MRGMLITSGPLQGPSAIIRSSTSRSSAPTSKSADQARSSRPRGSLVTEMAALSRIRCWTGGTWRPCPRQGLSTSTSRPLTQSHLHQQRPPHGTLVVDDGNGASDSDTPAVTVSDVPPTLSIAGFATGLLPAPVNLSVDFSFTDPGTADTHTVDCDWSDGVVQSFSPVASPGSCHPTRTDVCFYDPGPDVKGDE